MKICKKTTALQRLAASMILLLIPVILSGCGADLLNTLQGTNKSTNPQLVATNTAAPTPELVSIPTVESDDPSETPVPTLPSANTSGEIPGLIIYSLAEGGYFHLFAWHPETLPPTRLTYGEWDDKHPAISPDGRHLAFTSNRLGHWDLFILDLTTGITTQLTDDPAYEGHPDWSSDGIWLAYEKYVENNLDIYTRSFAADVGELRITTHPSPDFEPAWQPGSTLLAFSSARNGAIDIYFAETGGESAPQNYTFNQTLDQRSPAWSPDGGTLVWVSRGKHYPALFRAEHSEQAAQAKSVTASVESVWDPTGKYLLSVQSIPDAAWLAIQEAAALNYVVLPTQFPGQIAGIDWGANALPVDLPAGIKEAAQSQPPAPWLDELIPSAGALSGRQNLIDLPGIKAPHPALTGLAVQPFFALKDRANAELGWDLLSDLENMFVLITEPLPPGRQNDWLYTGRAFALNPVLIDYQYMLVVREEFGPDTYWRLFLKPLDQSGMMGEPLTQYPWDFDARFSGSPTAYENGGAPYLEIPGGYWVDFTTMALNYGWERTPALVTWQSYIQGAQFNVFAITSGLDWEDAMLQLWPPEIFLGQN
ncbi:MAG: PD40 domain-containing protein [Anaerolineales bacterium]|nr:PD40 domain-containing protein [Anaerolineales bacterium]